MCRMQDVLTCHGLSAWRVQTAAAAPGTWSMAAGTPQYAAAGAGLPTETLLAHAPLPLDLQHRSGSQTVPGEPQLKITS